MDLDYKIHLKINLMLKINMDFSCVFVFVCIKYKNDKFTSESKVINEKLHLYMLFEQGNENRNTNLC